MKKAIFSSILAIFVLVNLEAMAGDGKDGQVGTQGSSGQEGKNGSIGFNFIPICYWVNKATNLIVLLGPQILKYSNFFLVTIQMQKALIKNLH